MKDHLRHKYRLLKITAIVIGCLALAAYLLWVNADRILTSFADQKLKELSAKSDSFALSYSKLDLNLAKGVISLSDVSFSKDSIKATADKLEAGGVSLLKAWRSRQLLLDYLVADGVKFSAGLARKVKADTLATDSVSVDKLAGIKKYLDTIGVERVILNGGDMSFHRLSDKMKAAIGELHLTLYGLGYGVSAGEFSYCDSLYDLKLNSLSFTSANGLYSLSLDSIEAKNSGAVVIRNFRGKNTVGKKELSRHKGNVPVSWTDIQIKKLRTSHVNLIRSVNEKNIKIDSLFVEGKQMDVFRDARHLPKAELKMPQQAIESIPVPLHIGIVELQMPYLKMENLPKKGGTGALTLHDVGATFSNVTNKPGNTVKAHIRPHLGKGKGNIRLSLTLDKNSSFSITADISGLKGSDLETLLHPMFGVSVSADINKLNSTISGNRHSASGSFCLQYNDLKVIVDKDNGPYEKLSEKAGLINKFAGVAIHKENPRKNQAEPYTCEVSVSRDPMKNYGAYLVSALLDGVKKTVLRDLAYKEVNKRMGRKKH